jgi:hypothetical protein
MGPIRFLALRRMHLAHRALLHADPSEATVTDIVTNRGLWEFGRFSEVYRELFGELPSETLLRPAGQTATLSPGRFQRLQALGITMNDLPLNPREKQILRRLAKGWSTKRISNPSCSASCN